MIIKYVQSVSAKFMHASHFSFGNEHAQATKWGLAVLYNKSTIIIIIFIVVPIYPYLIQQ
jgi:hypothetical protein